MRTYRTDKAEANTNFTNDTNVTKRERNIIV